jgi:hypothetical protein
MWGEWIKLDRAGGGCPDEYGDEDQDVDGAHQILHFEDSLSAK